MSYLPSNGIGWQGIGVQKQPWFALPTEGLGDDAYVVWWIVTQPSPGGGTMVIGSGASSNSSALEDVKRNYANQGATVNSFSSEASMNAFLKKITGGSGGMFDSVMSSLTSKSPSGGMSTGAKVAIGLGVVVGAALLLRKRR